MTAFFSTTSDSPWNFRVAVFAVLCFLLVILRFYHLDMDSPANNVACITQPDESYYTYMAVHEQVAAKPGFPAEFTSPNNASLHVHSYLPTKLGFLLFGNTYWGLRIPVVLMSLIAVFLISLSIVGSFTSKPRIPVFLGICIFLLADPYFFVVSRFQSPQIYVIFWHSIAIYLLYRYSKTQKNIYLISATSLFFVIIFLVYPYSLFAFMGIGLFLLYKSFEGKTFRYIFLGCISLIIASLIVMGIFAMFNSSVGDYIQYLAKFKEARNETAQINNFDFKHLLVSPLQIYFTFLLRYNPIYFFIIHLFFFYMLTKWKSTTTLEKVNFFILLAAFLQTNFILSYPFKKWACLLPFLAITILPVARYIRDSAALSAWHKRIILLLSVISIMLCIRNISVNNNHTYWAAFDYGFEYQTPDFFMRYTSIIFALIIFVYIVISMYKTISIKHQIIAYLIILLGCFITIWSMVFRNERFEYRDLLVQNASLLDKKIIVGDLSAAYTFYNSSFELVNPYAEEIGVDMRLAQNVGKLNVHQLVIIKCYKPCTRKERILKSYGLDFKLIKDVPGSLYSFGIYTPAALSVNKESK